MQSEDGTVVEILLTQIQEFAEKFEAASEPVKEKLQNVYDAVQQQIPQVEKIRTAIEKLLGANDTTTEAPPEEDTSLLDELLRLAQEGIGAFDRRYDQLQKDLETQSSAPLLGGEALLQMLN